MRVEQTSFCRERTADIQYIILHCSRNEPNGILQVLNERELSAHYIIGSDGETVENCAPEKVAYHAGLSRWCGSQEKSLNGCSIGIEITAPTLGQYAADYSEAAITALIHLVHLLKEKYHIRTENIIGHSDIAPDRKPDPGVGFPWQKLALNGIGVWYDKAILATETDEEKLLADIGYDVRNLNAARYAFCRHFYPQDVKIIEDIHTLVNHPVEENFMPKDKTEYQQILRAVAQAFAHYRKF